MDHVLVHYHGKRCLHVAAEIAARWHQKMLSNNHTSIPVQDILRRYTFKRKSSLFCNKGQHGLSQQLYWSLGAVEQLKLLRSLTYEHFKPAHSPAACFCCLFQQLRLDWSIDSIKDQPVGMKIAGWPRRDILLWMHSYRCAVDQDISSDAPTDDFSR